MLIMGLLIALGLFAKGFWYGMSALLTLSLIDWCLFKILPDVMVCYGCGAKFKNMTNVQNIKPFDHHIAEGYRHS